MRIGPLEVTIVLCWVGVPLLILGTLYFVIRAAVKAGMKDSKKEQ